MSQNLSSERCVFFLITMPPPIFSFYGFFSRGHVTLYFAVSVRPSVRLSVTLLLRLFFCLFYGLSQFELCMSVWFVSFFLVVLPLPNRPRLLPVVGFFFSLLLRHLVFSDGGQEDCDVIWFSPLDSMYSCRPRIFCEWRQISWVECQFARANR